MEITMASEYLLKAPRTLREACRNIGAAYPELIMSDCAACPHGELCAISEQIERDRHSHGTKMEAKPSRKAPLEARP
jgi:hypothetical protein